MINQKTISRRNISLSTIGLALITLPFSMRICHISLIIFLVFWALEGKWDQKFQIIKGSIILQAIIALAILQLVGLFYTENITDGLSRIEKKALLFLIPLALATKDTKFEPKEIRLLFYLFVVSCFIGVMICLVNAAWQTRSYINGEVSFTNIGYLNSSYFWEFNPSTKVPWFFFSYIGLAEGINIHPTYFSLYLALCIIFLLHEIFAVDDKPAVKRNISIIIVLLFSAVIALLSSRIIILCLFLIYLATSAYWLCRKKSTASTAYMVIMLLVIMSFVLYINPVSRYRNLQEYTKSGLDVREKTTYKTSAEIRASLWWLAWKTYVHNNLWFGSGTGDVKDEMKHSSDKYEITNILKSYDPHNQFLFTLIANGILGLSILMLWLAVPLVLSVRRQDFFYMAFSFLFVALCLTESALELQKGIVFFAIVHPLLAFQRQSFQSQDVTLKLFGARS